MSLVRGIWTDKSKDTYFLCPASSHLEGAAHLPAPLEDVLDHVLAAAPHLVALLHEVLAEAHPVHPVGAEGSGLEFRNQSYLFDEWNALP